MSTTSNEPAVTRGVAVALVAAVIGVVVAFGVPVTDDQRDAVLILVGVAAPLIGAWWTRRHVTPSTQVVAQLDGKSGEVVAGEASPLPTGLILEPGATVQEITP